MVLRKSVTIGANATIVRGVEIGQYAFVRARTVVNPRVFTRSLWVIVKFSWMCVVTAPCLLCRRVRRFRMHLSLL